VTDIPLDPGFSGIHEDSHSIIVPVSFFRCRCPKHWLRGAFAEQLAAILRQAIERAGFPVVGHSIEYFGNSPNERELFGATLNFILQDSGVSFDVYPDVPGDENGNVQMNLHYCNISHDNDHKVPSCIAHVSWILRPCKKIVYPRHMMPITLGTALKQLGLE